jgi:hypothetical protein
MLGTCCFMDTRTCYLLGTAQHSTPPSYHTKSENLGLATQGLARNAMRQQTTQNDATQQHMCCTRRAVQAPYLCTYHT